jgi:uncharacterized protein (DUF779 family)
LTIEFVATDEARAALARARAEHGALMFHLTSGRCQSRCPLCLPAEELRLGGRDIHIGDVEGVPIYEMESTPSDGSCSANSYILDLEPGMTIGFSIVASPGLRFVLRPRQRPSIDPTTL